MDFNYGDSALISGKVSRVSCTVTVIFTRVATANYGNDYEGLQMPSFVSPPPLPQQTEWHVAINGESCGPLSERDIRSLLASGEIDNDTLVWREGMDEWCLLRRTELVAMGSSLPPPLPETSDSEQILAPAGSSSSDTFRMIDWLQSWKSPFLCGGFVAVLGVALNFGNATAVRNSFIVGAIFAAWTMIVQLRGIFFDQGSDRLTYPMFFFRRSVRLSQIADANCQTKAGTDDPLSLFIKLLGHTPTDRSESRRFIVNLSGEFGARRVQFHSKYKRDEFLSLLRRYAPDCRITRWA